MLDFLQALDAFVVVEALGLHFRHRAVALLALLSPQNLPGVFERGLHHRDEVERVVVVLAVEQLDCGKQKRRQRLVEGQVVRHVVSQLVVGALLVVSLLDDAGGYERGEYLGAAQVQALLFSRLLCGVVDELVHARTRIAALEHLV